MVLVRLLRTFQFLIHDTGPVGSTDYLFPRCGHDLLWLNLRMWRGTGLSITPENYDRPEDHEQRTALPPREADGLMTWSTPFDDPINLPDGRKLITLRDAATYITELPEAERQECQIAARSLIAAAEHQDLIMQAYIDVLSAIHRSEASCSPIPIAGVVPPIAPEEWVGVVAHTPQEAERCRANETAMESARSLAILPAGRLHITFRFSALSLPLFGTMS
jgi:hypothetical protein